MTLPLAGIRVLDLSRFFAGPFCTQILADYGAEVIKVEDPVMGDPGRWVPPIIEGQSALFFTVNRNKKSVTIDMRKDEGKELFKQLVQQSDVVIDAFRPGVMEKLGLGYGELSSVNQGIIYCALNGYGSSGPLKESPGHDINFLSLAGVNLLTASRSGVPALSSAQIAGGSGALNAVIAILMALFSRQQTGKGQFCDVSMVDSSLSLLSYAMGDWAGSGQFPSPGGERLTGGNACYNIYETKDGKYISIGAVEEKFWVKFCEGIGRKEFIASQWADDQQMKMIEEIEQITKQRTRQEWEDVFAGQEICFAPVLTLDEIGSHPHIQERGTVFATEQAGIKLPLVGPAARLSKTPAQVDCTFSSLGEHNKELLDMLGYTEQDREKLKKIGVIS
ncbi:MAG: CoA transferase [Bacillota bacterium]|nr:CoA transferase [Bacillota bacterium]